MFKRVLIANRGLIQANCVRAVKELGATAIAVFEEADRDSAGVRNADEAYELKVRNARLRPYLDIAQIVELAETLKVDAVHPGYGFLAQNAEFGQALAERDIQLIAPRSQGRLSLSNKHEVKAAARKAGLPVLRGTALIADREQLLAAAAQIGYPLVMKAAHGYGGLGMRLIRDERRLVSSYEQIQAQCRKFLMNSQEIFLEEYVEGARLLEFPVLRDAEGRTLVLPELECPLQRRFQKLLLETPAPHLDPDMRARLQSEIQVLCERLKVFGFASVEFLLKAGKPQFLELNGYIQPSHTATTLLTGVDVLKEQIRLHSGASLAGHPPTLTGASHVVATYIFAEDPEQNFAPSPGVVDRLYLPFGEEVFMQTSIFSGARISPFYDPMIAKLVARGGSREEAILKLRITLEEFFVEGVKTNIPLMRGVLNAGELADGTLSPEHIATPARRRALIDSLKTAQTHEFAALVAALALHRDGETLQRMHIQDTERGAESVLGAATRWLRPRKQRRTL